jgi:molecular chaperone GrpE
MREKNNNNQSKESEIPQVEETSSIKKRLSPLRKLKGENDSIKTENDNIKAENEKLSAQIAELKDQNLRLLSEFENFRRRKAVESMQISDAVKKDFLIKLLPILDDSERLFKHQNSNSDNIVEGIRLITDKFHAILENMGLKTMDLTGKNFDPETCEALLMVEKPGCESGSIVDVIEPGYMLNDTVLRHAKVIVNK